jgi:hypothetical protein
MNEETFNVSVRQFLKKFGITAQREIERAVDGALKSGKLKGDETLQARAVLRIEGVPADITVEGDITLG